MNLEQTIQYLQQAQGKASAQTPQSQFLMNYWNKIQQYKGTEYYQQMLNNPYLVDGSEYGGNAISQFLNNSSWGSILNALSFGLTGSIGDSMQDSGRNNFLQSQNQAANEELDRLLGIIQQNQYNSPSAQMSRQIAAGINPALVGAGGEAAAGSPGPDETASPLSAQEVGAGQMQGASQMAGIISNFFGGFMNMVTFFQDTQAKSIANASGDMDLLDTVYNTALKTAAGMSSLPSTREEYDKLTEEEKLGADETIYDTLQAAVKQGSLGSMVLNRRAKSMLKKMTGRVMYDSNGKPTLAFQQQRAAMLKSFYGDTLEAGKAGGHPIMGDPENFAKVLEKSVQFFGDYEDKLMEYQKVMFDINQRLASAQATSAESQATYDAATLTEEVGESDRELHLLENQAKKLDSELDALLDGALNDLDQYGLPGKIAKVSILSIRSVLKSITAAYGPHGKSGKMMPSFGINP